MDIYKTMDRYVKSSQVGCESSIGHIILFWIQFELNLLGIPGNESNKTIRRRDFSHDSPYHQRGYARHVQIQLRLEKP